MVPRNFYTEILILKTRVFFLGFGSSRVEALILEINVLAGWFK